MSFIFIVFLNLTVVVIAIYYCDPTLCKSGQKHIACKTMGRIYANCPADTKTIRFNSSSKNILLDVHNEKRNYIAGGWNGSREPACRMATTLWSSDLAYLASLNVMKCALGYDSCHNTKIFKYSGQTLALLQYSGSIKYGELLIKAIELWFKESESLENNDGLPIFVGPLNNYTVFAADRNIRVGCAATTFSTSRTSKFFLLACNYATRTVIPFPIYATCTTAGSYCATGVNPRYPNLCSISEIYSLNKWTRLKLALAKDSDYCSKSLCKNGTRHIACGHSGMFSFTCPRDAKLVNMNREIKNILMHGHNSIRNYIAGGGAGKLGPACRMAAMLWDDELASLASLNVRKCDLEHDFCHNTDKFKNSGQNLSWRSVKGRVDSAKEVIRALKLWVSQVRFSNMEYINKYPSETNGTDIREFSVMVIDNNNRVGCAISTYTFQRAPYRAFLLACNYATNTVFDSPVYESCSVPTSGCLTGRNSAYPNLCSTSETYD